jgi:hypothetical protein
MSVWAEPELIKINYSSLIFSVSCTAHTGENSPFLLDYSPSLNNQRCEECKVTELQGRGEVCKWHVSAKISSYPALAVARRHSAGTGGRNF